MLCPGDSRQNIQNHDIVDFYKTLRSAERQTQTITVGSKHARTMTDVAIPWCEFGELSSWIPKPVIREKSVMMNNSGNVCVGTAT